MEALRIRFCTEDHMIVSSDPRPAIQPLLGLSYSTCLDFILPKALLWVKASAK